VASDRPPPADDTLDGLFTPDDRQRLAPAVAEWLRRLLDSGESAGCDASPRPEAAADARRARERAAS
jgi:hypothetical protein